MQAVRLENHLCCRPRLEGGLVKQIFAVSSLMFGLFIVLASCSDDKNPVQQYGNTMTQSYKSAQKLDASVNVQQVRKSIQEFYAANGRYPADLNELSGFNGITLKGDKYEYDPATGTLAEKQ